MKYKYVIAFHDNERTETIESNYLPTFKIDKDNNDVWLVIYGKECGYYFYVCNAYIKAMFIKI